MSIKIEYDSFTICTDNKNDDIVIILKKLFLSIPGDVFLVYLISLMKYTSLKPLTTFINIKKFFYPTRPVRFIITRPSECRKSVILTNLILSITKAFGKRDIYSSSLHRDIYQKSPKSLSYLKPQNILSNIPNEEDIDLIFHGRV